MPNETHPPDEAYLVGRAIKAAGRRWPIDHRRSAVRELAGLRYVVLVTHPPETRLVYRVHNNDRLRQMIDPPPELLGGEA